MKESKREIIEDFWKPRKPKPIKLIHVHLEDYGHHVEINEDFGNEHS